MSLTETFCSRDEVTSLRIVENKIVIFAAIGYRHLVDTSNENVST